MGTPPLPAMSEQQVLESAGYITHRAKLLDHDLLPYGDPKDKDVLVFGAGLGNEILWCARHGAKSTVAIDLSPVRSQALEHLLRVENLSPVYEMRQEDITDTATKGEKFDLIISNGVFEHVMDLKGVLLAFRPLLKRHGRIAIFADGLYYSSIGGHLGKNRWEHLWMNHRQIKTEIPSRWHIYQSRLNRMTCVDFLEAIRATGLLVHQLRMGRDPFLKDLPEYIDRIQAAGQTTMTDLSIVSIGCELSFIENL